MDVIPLNASLVKGSHGQTNVTNTKKKPIYIGTKNTKENLKAIDIANIIKKELEQ